VDENYKSISNKLYSLIFGLDFLVSNQKELKDELNEIKYSDKTEFSIIKSKIDVLKRNNENHFKILTLTVALTGLLLGGLYFSINMSINSSRNETNTKLDMLNQKLDSQKEIDTKKGAN